MQAWFSQLGEVTDKKSWVRDQSFPPKRSVHVGALKVVDKILFTHRYNLKRYTQADGKPQL